MPILENVDAIINGAGENSKDFHEEAPAGNLEEESVADRPDLPLFVQQCFGDEIISIDGECSVVRDQQGRTSRRNFFETLNENS